MVVVGIWPYQHTYTLRLIASQGKMSPVYFVDEDRIIHISDAKAHVGNGYHLDELYMTLMSPEIYVHVVSYKEQSFPPPIPASVKALIQSHENTFPKGPGGESIMRGIEDVSEHAPMAIVGDQSRDVMQDIGARYAPNLGLWLLDANHLKILREKRAQKYGGKVKMTQHPGGSMVEIRGDVSPYIQRLKDARGIYDEDRDVWLVPISTINQIYDLISS